MSSRMDISTTVADANPIRLAEAAVLLPDDVRGRFLEAVVLEPGGAPPSRRRGRAARRRSIIASPTPRIAAIAVVIGVVLASLTLLTAPGRAVTSWVGDRLGLGEPGGHPTLHVMRARASVGTSAEGQPAWVLAVGPAPHGGRYELVTYWPGTPKRHLKNQGHGHWLLGRPCFELDLTQERQTIGQDCGTLSQGPDLYLTLGAVSSSGFDRSSYLFFDGRVSARAAKVEAEVDGRPVPLDVKPIPEALVRRFRLEQPFSFFIAFLPPILREGGRLTVTARRADGSVLARRSEALPNFEGMRRASCTIAHTAMRRGLETRRAAMHDIAENCGPLGPLHR
ncbi:MAG: hypothetical protein JST31_08710 [Actinobacteria bacterium]|nr:hypothetical protein [Actinomycetota bacterium]